MENQKEKSISKGLLREKLKIQRENGNDSSIRKWKTSPCRNWEEKYILTEWKLTNV